MADIVRNQGVPAVAPAAAPAVAPEVAHELLPAPAAIKGEVPGLRSGAAKEKRLSCFGPLPSMPGAEGHPAAVGQAQFMYHPLGDEDFVGIADECDYARRGLAQHTSEMSDDSSKADMNLRLAQRLVLTDLEQDASSRETARMMEDHASTRSPWQ
eukprot:545102-Prymnesium_polylepis.1